MKSKTSPFINFADCSLAKLNEAQEPIQDIIFIAKSKKQPCTLEITVKPNYDKETVQEFINTNVQLGVNCEIKELQD